LQQADQGDRAAAEQLFPLVEPMLRELARRQASFRNFEVSTTVLVDHAFAALVGTGATDWQPGDRRKFFRYAARQMHSLLVDACRRANSQRRGGGWKSVSGAVEELPLVEDPGAYLDFLLDLDAALERLAQFAPADALLFRVHFLLGYPVVEAAQEAGVSAAEAVEALARARAWLRASLKDYHKR
jgi:RNA polymerase sigma factor (TIGR02999 family)